MLSATILHNLTDHSLSISPGIEGNIAEDIYLAAGAALGILHMNVVSIFIERLFLPRRVGER